MMRARRNERLQSVRGSLVASSMLALLVLSACDEPASTNGDACVSDVEFFQEQVYAPILARNCQTCHSEQGAAKNTSFVLRGPEWGPDYIEQNLEMFTQLAKLEFEGTPWILLKPTQRIPHEGGVRFEEGSEEYKIFVEMIDRIANPTVCENERAETFFDDVELLDEVETLRKATLSLVGRLPTLDEEQQVRDGGFDALDLVLDEVMQEDAFYVRLKEIYNDHFLTDRYYFGNGTPAIDLLDVDPEEGKYPSAYWYETEYPGEDQGDLRRQMAAFTNRAVAREPLELVAYVVRNDLPYTEILTADYTMVNWYSARSFGVRFDGPEEYGTFKPAKVEGIPHAGVLTSTVWMNRFPTTPTNRNRHRARMLFEFFLATDVQALGNRPVDATAIEGVNPTLNDPNCTICHDVIDPIAGGFQNWDDQGRYRPPEMGWYGDMLPTGFGDETMPNANARAALQWVVQQVKDDRRFALSAIHIMFTGLSGQVPLKEPDDAQIPGYLEAIKAAKEQQKVFNEIATEFVESNYNLKTVVKELVKTPYYRAHNARLELDESRAAELAEVGTGRLLTPEQLNRKIVATTGLPWRPRVDSTDYLLDPNFFQIYYGGIDSDAVTKRITEPNGVMANIARRMANEMACVSVARDFAKDPSDRIMFPLVDVTYQPEDANGFEIPLAAANIRGNIQFLAERLWGQYLEINDAEVNRIFELFIGVWKDGKRGLTLPEDDPGRYTRNLECNATSDYFTGEPLPDGRAITDDPNYTVRAWMAVITYMLSDYRFLHE